MNPLVTPESKAVKTQVALPFITIALQIDSANGSKSQYEQKIKMLVNKVENDLNIIKGIPEYMVLPATNKLKSIIYSLNHSLGKRSVIIFLSPFAEKVYYSNYLIEEKVIVGEPLNLREIIRFRKEEAKFLVLSLHADKSFIYLGEGKKLNLIVFNSADHVRTHFNTKKEKFLLHIDNVLGQILKTYSLPLIAVGSEQMLSKFKSISSNAREIIETVNAEAVMENPLEIQQLTETVISSWKSIKQKYLLGKLEKAINNKRAERGIYKVVKAAKEKRGKVLLLEEDYYYEQHFSDATDQKASNVVSSNGALLMADPVEDAIERILADGGYVEFVEPDALKDHMRIALIC
jgi:hypothetical protein